MSPGVISYSSHYEKSAYSPLIIFSGMKMSPLGNSVPVDAFVEKYVINSPLPYECTTLSC